MAIGNGDSWISGGQNKGGEDVRSSCRMSQNP